MGDSSPDELEHIVGTAMWPGSLQTVGELDMRDFRDRLIDVPVVDSADNRGLGDVSFEQVDEMSSVWLLSSAGELVSWG